MKKRKDKTDMQKGNTETTNYRHMKDTGREVEISNLNSLLVSSIQWEMLDFLSSVPY